MKTVKDLLLFSCLVFSFFGMKAQDIHFTMFDMSPLTLNPASTGAFEGTFRIGGIYRDQWGSLIGRPGQYKTPAIYIDAPLFRGFGKKDWIGGGVSILNDRAGSGVLTNLSAGLSLAYHLGLGKKGNTYLSIGGQGGLVQKKVDIQKLNFASEYESNTGGFTGANTENVARPTVSYPDFNLGMGLNTYFSSKVNMNIGVAALHIAQPKDNFLSPEAKNQMVLATNVGFNFDLGTRMVLSPMVLYQTKAKASELNATAMLGFHLNQEKDITFLVGGGIRPGDAILTRIGMNFKGFKAGLAYDVNTSQLNAVSNGRGGFEVALSYTARIFKTPVIKPILFCPRF